MTAIDPQEFGEIRAQVAALLQSDAEKTKLLAVMAGELTTIRLQLAEARGGWRMLMFLGGSAGALGAGLGAWLTHLVGKGPAS